MSNVLDSLYLGVFFIIFCIAAAVGLMVFNSLVPTGIIPANLVAPLKGFYTSLNGVALFLMVGLSLGAIGSALMIKTHPFFLIIAIILVFVQAVVIPPIVNSYNSIMTSDSMVAVATEQADLSTAVNILPPFTMFMTIAAALVGIIRE